MQAATHGHGTVLRHNLEVATYDCDEMNAVPYVESIVIHNPEKNEAIIFAVNRSENETVDLAVELQGFELTNVLEFSEISGHDIKQINEKNNEPVAPTTSKEATVKNNELSAKLQPLSWNVVRVGLK